MVKITGEKPKKGGNPNPKPLPPGPGRPRGSTNRLSGQLKEMILAALDKAGGVNYLLRQAEESPTAFLTLVGKVLPMTVSGDPDSPITHSVTVEFVSGKNSDT